MFIVDAHLDLAWNALQWNRDITQSVYRLRPQEFGMEGPGRAMNTVALPEIHQGRIALSIATLLARSTGTPVPHIDYATPQQAFAIARGQLAYYRALEATRHLRIITDIDSLNDHISGWEAWFQRLAGTPNPGIVISMESADPIIHPDTLQEWWELGLRLIGPAHYGAGRYAGGTSVEDGLSDLGVHLLKEMTRLNIILDMTHLSDRAFWQALDHYDGLVIASHNNCRELVPGQRQFSDEQLQAIIARGGAIGVSLDAWMLKPGWIKDVTTNEGVTLASVVDHIDHICQLAGNAQHAAIGSDLDGGFGREQSPSDLDTIADLQKLIPLMQNRGYSDNDIAAIMHGNWLGILRKVWGK
jgi:membrane dipeptidase